MYCVAMCIRDVLCVGGVHACVRVCVCVYVFNTVCLRTFLVSSVRYMFTSLEGKILQGRISLEYGEDATE